MGVEKSADAEIHIAMKKGIGLTPSWVARDKAKGKPKAAAALFVINAVMTLEIRYNAPSRI